MKNKKSILTVFSHGIAIALIVMGTAATAQTKQQGDKYFRSLERSPGLNKTRMNTVGESVGFDKWARTENRRVAPRIDKRLLDNPSLVDRESITFTHVLFDGEAWGKTNVSWSKPPAQRKDTVDRLPPEREKALLNKLPPDKRRDPIFVKEYIGSKLKRYRKVAKSSVADQLSIEMVLAPSSRAAHEYLLAAITDNTLPTGGLLKKYSTEARSNKLGQIGYIIESPGKDTRIRFVRDNVFVSIRANGSFVNEANALAKKIDAMISEQPSLSLKRLVTRRPSAETGAKARDKSKLPYEISTPEDREVVSVYALVNDQWTAAKDGYISLAGVKGRARVRLFAITSELLVASTEVVVTQ
ncbi:MAG: hypothetical protein GY854_24525 [Deltaproteobacteria bacterium]|nr:hypothetical protein [Deltaproteobacteria bacterium]